MSELKVLYPIGKCLWFGCDYLRLCFGYQYESGILDRYFSGLSANSNELFANCRGWGNEAVMTLNPPQSLLHHFHILSTSHLHPRRFASGFEGFAQANVLKFPIMAF